MMLETPQVSAEESRLSRGVSQRIIAHEKKSLQVRFLTELGRQPFSRYLTLTGTAALRGVYLRQPWGGHLDFEAPPAIAAHFALLANVFGKSLRRFDDQFIFEGRGIAAPEMYIRITVSGRRTLPPAPEERLFTAGNSQVIPVHVTPLADLLDDLLGRLRRNPRPSDLLELWLFCRDNPETRDAVLASAKRRSKQEAFSGVLTVEQIRRLKSDWQSELKEVSFHLPPMVRVYRDLKAWLAVESSAGDAQVL